MKIFTCRFDDADFELLDNIAKSQGRSVANLIRIITKDYISKTDSAGKSNPVTNSKCSLKNTKK